MHLSDTILVCQAVIEVWQLDVQISEASERQIAHLRAQAATSSGQHVEALRKAHDICALAESRADAAERSVLLGHFATLSMPCQGA